MIEYTTDFKDEWTVEKREADEKRSENRREIMKLNIATEDKRVKIRVWRETTFMV